MSSDLIDSTSFAKQMTTNWKAHKNPPENRIVVGCPDRANHPNFYRKVHHAATEGMTAILDEYRGMALEGGGKRKRSYNIVDNIQDLARKVRAKGHKRGKLEVADCSKCFPSHSVKPSKVHKGEGWEQLVGPVPSWEWKTLRKSESRLRQPTVAEMFAASGAGEGGPLYVKVHSSLAMLKKLIVEVLEHVSDREGGDATMLLQGKGKNAKWSLGVATQGGRSSKGPVVSLTADQFVRLLVGSLDNQVVTFGDEVLRVKDGLLEGEETSMITQNIYFQSVINTEVDELESQGRQAEAQELKEEMEAYADDAADLGGGMIGPRRHTMMREQFILEYGCSDVDIVYVGIHVYLCKHCEHGLGTRPDMSKHGGNLLSPAIC